MNILIDSPGGSTAGAGIAGVNVELLRAGIIPKVYIVTSVSAIFAPALALSINPKYKYLQRLVLDKTANVTMKEMFPKWPPFNSKGKLTWRALFRIATGRLGLGVQNTRHYISNYISTKMWEEYCKDSQYPKIYVVTYNYKKRDIEYHDIKYYSYGQMLDIIDASAFMPMVQPAIIPDQNNIPTAMYDGGWMDRNAAEKSKHILKENNIDTVFSIYHSKQRGEAPNHIPKNNSEIVGEYFASLLQQQARADEVGFKEAIRSAGLKIDHYPIRIKNIMKSFYDTDPTRLKLMQEEARKETQKRLKNIEL